MNNADPTDTRRRLIHLISGGLGITCSWDFHLVHDLGYPVETVADIRDVSRGAVAGNVSSSREALGLERPRDKPRNDVPRLDGFEATDGQVRDAVERDEREEQ